MKDFPLATLATNLFVFVTVYTQLEIGHGDLFVTLLKV